MTETLQQLTVDEYHRMLQANMVPDPENAELLDGWIVKQPARTPAHDACVSLASGCLDRVVPGNLVLRVRSAITLSSSEPQPDLAIVDGPATRYTGGHPRPGDVGLVIEVAEKSLVNDRDSKGRIYARAGLPMYWVINIVENIVEVYSRPGPGGYQHRQNYGRGDMVPLVLGGQEIAKVSAADLLG